jgi:hypothetical protein
VQEAQEDRVGLLDKELDQVFDYSKRHIMLKLTFIFVLQVELVALEVRYYYES